MSDLETLEIDETLAKKGSVVWEKEKEITESGVYNGVITKVRLVDRQGAEGVEITFRCADGFVATNIRVETKDKNGKPCPGLNQIHALMKCLNVNKVTATGRFSNYSMACVYPELENKEIKLALESECLGDCGTECYKLNIVAFFNAETDKTAAEIIENAPGFAIYNIAKELKKQRISRTLTS